MYLDYHSTSFHNFYKIIIPSHTPAWSCL